MWYHSFASPQIWNHGELGYDSVKQINYNINIPHPSLFATSMPFIRKIAFFFQKHSPYALQTAKFGDIVSKFGDPVMRCRKNVLNKT